MGTTMVILVMVLVSLAFQICGAHLNATVRAADCINNSTHCHCALKQAGANSQCYKPVPGENAQCFKGKCAAGYHCDCDADDICEKVSTVYYIVEGSPTSETFPCIQDQTKVPRRIVGLSSDFHVMAMQEFQLFVNTEQIGFGESNVYKVFTAEIHPGDVIGVIARRQSSDKYGVKLRFLDAERETRFIDENWYVSPSFSSGWLGKSFDPSSYGWSRPSMANIATPGFDANTPWMWFGSADTVYFRYSLPQTIV